MLIKKLTLDGFKSVESQTFEFNKGIICFSGDNGQGKSTVIHALLILLFNFCDLSFKDYINWSRSKFKISVLFDHEGEEYFEDFEYSEKSGSKRILKKTSTNELWENSAALSKLSEIIDPDLAKASIVSMENEQNLITTTPAKRREYLKGVYNLEFKEQLDAIAKDTVETDRDKTRLESDVALLQSQTFELKEHHESYDEQTYTEAKNNRNVLNAQLGNLMLQKQKRAEVMQRIGDHSLGIRRNTQQISSIESNVHVLETDIENTKSLLEAKKNEDLTPEYQDKLEELQKAFEAKRLDIVRQTKLKMTELSLQDTVDEKAIDLLMNTIMDLNTKMASADYARSMCKSQLEVMETHKCPTCGREITEEECEKERAKYNELDQNCKNIKIALDTAIQEKNKLVESKSQIDANTKKIQNEIDSLERCLSDIEHSYESGKLKIQHELENYESNKENEILRYQTVIESSQKNLDSQLDMKSQCSELLETHRKELDRLENELKQMDNPEDAIVEINSKISSYDEIVNAYEGAVKYNSWVDEYNSEQKQKEAQRDEKVRSMQNEIKSCAERLAMLDKSKSIVMREFPSFVISYMVKSLENYTNEFLQKVYPKYELEITESKNSLAVTYGPKNADVRMASGFEKSVFSLAYMYALGKMQQYGMLIIDEGDGAASDANSLQFYNTVAKSQEFFPQIFCITHKEVAKDLLENTYHAQVYNADGGKYYRS